MAKIRPLYRACVAKVRSRYKQDDLPLGSLWLPSLGQGTALARPEYGLATGVPNSLVLKTCCVNNLLCKDSKQASACGDSKNY